MSVAADAEVGASAVRPSLEEARALAAEHNLIAISERFIDDCETPVSAFLKLRTLAPGEPAFLLESAEQGQRVGRYSFIGVRPRSVLRWSPGDEVEALNEFDTLTEEKAGWLQEHTVYANRN